MNLYERRRWFGSLPELPADSRLRDTDRLLDELKNAWRDQPDDPRHLSRLFAFALEFSRLDSLSNILTPDDWEAGPAALLHRGHLKFYRAMAENPESPASALLSDAADDFRKASSDAESAFEALAALVRLTALEAGTRKALAPLRRLERLAGPSARRAASGARLFLAGLPGTDGKSMVRHLGKARRQLRSRGISYEDSLVSAEIDILTSRRDRAESTWRRLEELGSSEARCRLLEDATAAYVGGMTAGDAESGERTRLMDRLRKYRNDCPMDPRAYMFEGEILLAVDPEAARMAWRGALVMDDRHAPAWARLGDLYYEAWERGGDGHAGSWLEAAGDSYLKAASLEPLEGRYRILAGMVERAAGRPARAVSSLVGAMALVEGYSGDKEEARRMLALSWTDLACSEDLNTEARSAAAGRARTVWADLLEGNERRLFDIIGLCRSVAIQSVAGSGLTRSSAALLDSLSAELVRGMDASMAGELIPLAEDYIAVGLADRVPELLDCAEKHLGTSHRILALRADITPRDDMKEALRLYLSAAETAGVQDRDYPEWMRRAASVSAAGGWADGAEQILRNALAQRPGEKTLIRELAGLLDRQGRAGDAVDLFRQEIDRQSPDADLLDDAVWFSRGAGRDDEALSFLEQTLKENPDDARTWNQLGVHHMETGWEETGDGGTGMTPLSLEQAVSAYRKAVKIDPGNSVYRGNLGDALRQAGEWTEAAKLLDEIVGAIPDDGPESGDAFVLNSLARLEDERSYAAEGSDSSAEDWQSAGEHYRMAADTDRGNTDFLRDHAWWLYRERRLEDAVSRYRTAAGIDPTDETLPHGEASCLRELGEEAEAMEALDRALAIRPDDTGMMADKAELLGLLGDDRGAERLLHRVIDVTDGAHWAIERLAFFYEDTAGRMAGPGELPLLHADGTVAGEPPFVRDCSGGDTGRLYSLALETWKGVAESRPEDRHVSARIGRILALIGRNDEAVEFLLASMEHRASDAEALNLLGLLYLDRNSEDSLDKAEKYLVSAMEKAPQHPAYHAHAGYLYACKGMWPQAFKAFSEASGREPDRILWLADAGIAALLAGEMNVAVHHLQKAVYERDEPEWHNGLGMALLSSGSPERAVEAFRTASLCEPDNETYLANLAMAHEGIHGPEPQIQ